MNAGASPDRISPPLRRALVAASITGAGIGLLFREFGFRVGLWFTDVGEICTMERVAQCLFSDGVDVIGDLFMFVTVSGSVACMLGPPRQTRFLMVDGACIVRAGWRGVLCGACQGVQVSD